MANFPIVKPGPTRPKVLAHGLSGNASQAFGLVVAPRSRIVLAASGLSGRTPQTFALVVDVFSLPEGDPSPGPEFEDVDITDPIYSELGFITDHCEQAKNRLMDWFRKPKMEQLICIHAERMQALEQQLANLLLLRSITTSLGAQLDKLGVNLNVSRNGLSDERYRVHLFAKTLVIACDGTADEVLEIIQTLDDGADVASIRWEPEYPAGYNLYFTVAAGEQLLAERWIRQFLRPATDAGIQRWHYFHQRDTRIFAWAAGPYDPTPGVLTGWAELSTPGGTWAEVL